MATPPGTDCIFVHFNAQISSLTPDTTCYLRAVINGELMDPALNGSGRVAVHGFGNFVTTHSWSRQVTQSMQTTYFIQVQLSRTEGTGTCFVSAWQLEVHRLD